MYLHGCICTDVFARMYLHGHLGMMQYLLPAGKQSCWKITHTLLPKAALTIGIASLWIFIIALTIHVLKRLTHLKAEAVVFLVLLDRFLNDDIVKMLFSKPKSQNKQNLPGGVKMGHPLFRAHPELQKERCAR